MDAPTAPARYFPVTPAPLRMQAGLLKFGAAFGNGEADERFFQLDRELPDYQRQKRLVPPQRHLVVDPQHPGFLAAVEWMERTLARESSEAWALAQREPARDRLEAIALHVQEDLAILGAGEDDLGIALGLDVRFPSGWHPERLAAADFSAIHAPVPGFADQRAASQSMVRAMVDRGPYVRFVWTLSADPHLDHHPESGLRARWPGAQEGWLRVERQVTVPLGPEVRTSVFLIRTYLYPLRELTRDERTIIGQALDAMSDEVRTYKSLPTRAQVEHLLED
jgi:dimethylamine monooxygenase subunit A